jgi:hypothetical protein
MKFLKYNEYQFINEIGEGVPSLPWNLIKSSPREWIRKFALSRTKTDIYEEWTELPQIAYGFESKAKYVCLVDGQFIRVSDGIHERPEIVLVCHFNFGTRGGGDKNLDLTNFNEHFSVVSTVSEIMRTVIGELYNVASLRFSRIVLAPAKEEGEELLDLKDTKRGRLYIAYLQKQIGKIPGKWRINIDNLEDRINLVQITDADQSKEEQSRISMIIKSYKNK